jgi:hypothetical protein
MLVYCYRIWSNDWTELDRLGLYAQRTEGWFSIGRGWVDYYVPESASTMFVLMNSELKYRSRDTWIM